MVRGFYGKLPEPAPESCMNPDVWTLGNGEDLRPCGMPAVEQSACDCVGTAARRSFRGRGNTA
ncbi:hypothetical protein IMSAGC003_02877 [Lachnospiraceae bacterium]|nr:hypothetical protein [Lachnospiraceae bacterium]MCX4273206.1 hypothetical protein [Acetatifactor sp.]GFH96322.1 hypothetical protein IMSAGC003_02877 [Lachnospiraceae bacterium]